MKFPPSSWNALGLAGLATERKPEARSQAQPR